MSRALQHTALLPWHLGHTPDVTGTITGWVSLCLVSGGIHEIMAPENTPNPVLHRFYLGVAQQALKGGDTQPLQEGDHAPKLEVSMG